MNACMDLREKLDAWLDGELGATEADEVREHVTACPDCAGERDEIAHTQASLGRFFQELRATAPAPRARPRSPRTLVLVAALAAAAVLVAWLIWGGDESGPDWREVVARAAGNLRDGGIVELPGEGAGLVRVTLAGEHLFWESRKESDGDLVRAGAIVPKGTWTYEAEANAVTMTGMVSVHDPDKGKGGGPPWPEGVWTLRRVVEELSRTTNLRVRDAVIEGNRKVIQVVVLAREGRGELLLTVVLEGDEIVSITGMGGGLPPGGVRVIDRDPEVDVPFRWQRWFPDAEVAADEMEQHLRALGYGNDR